MKKFYSILLCFIFVYSSLNAQKPPIQLSWLNTAPSYFNGGEFSAQGVTNLSDGSVVVVGYFQHTVDFDPGPDTFNLTTTAYYGIFIAKYTNQGKLVFAYGFSETNKSNFFDENPEFASAVTADANDDIYVTGSFRGEVDFDPDSGETILSTGTIASNKFLACYTKNGKLKFAKNITSGNVINYTTTYLSIVLDNNKNIYIAGGFGGTSIDFDPGPDTTNLTSAGSDDIFFAKYDSAGNYVFAKIIGGALYENVNKITLDKNNNILICGVFQSANVDFDPGTTTHILKRSGSKQDLFFAKYDANGNYIFAKNVGNYRYNYANSITVGKDNGYVLTGSFTGTLVDFDITNPGTHVLNSNGNTDVFVARYDANGNCVFAFNIGDGSGDDYGVDVGLDSNQNIICTGTFGGEGVDFDPSDKVHKIKNSIRGDYYLAKYSYNGNFISVIGLSIGSPFNQFQISCFHITATNKILIGGFYKDSFDVDAGPDSTILISPAPTMFVVKYDDNENYLGVIHGDNYFNYAIPYSKVTSSVIDKNGNIYVCGNFEGRYDFDPGPNKYILTSSVNIYENSTQNGFFAKYDSKGNLAYAKSIDGDNTINDIAIDNKGNVYITGKSDEFTDFDPGNKVYYLNHSDTIVYNQYNFFIAKYDNNGNLIYAKGNGSSGSFILNVTAIALDAKNNICIGGILNNLIDFDPGINTYILNGGSGLGNMFIAKYDSAGNYLFAACIKSTNSTGSVSDIKFDTKNNIVFTGYFHGTDLDFNAGPGKFLLSSVNSYNAGFITIYKNNGTFVSAISINGQDYSNNKFATLTTDKNDNIFIAGKTTNNADFDPGPGTAFLSDTHEPFFASYNNKLQFRFLKGLTSFGDHYQSGNDIEAITLDKYKNIYVAGEFVSKKIDCDPGPDTAVLINNYNNGSNYNLFIAKYDSLGNYSYSNQFKTDSAIGTNFSASILVHTDETIYYSGYAVSRINFATGNKKVYLQPSTFEGNIFIAQYQQNITQLMVLNTTVASKNIINTIKVYPNPITDKINVELNNIKQFTSTAVISLYDVNGKLVQTNKTTFINYNLNTTILLPQNLSRGNILSQ